MAIQDKQVQDYLTNKGINFQAVYLAKITTGDGKHYQWSVIFTDKRKGTVEIFEYSTCLGLVTKRPGGNVPTEPTAASVIHSLLLDSSAIDQSFEGWASDLGYDTDSRKSLSIYDACILGAKKLNNIFNKAQLAELAELLADY